MIIIKDYFPQGRNLIAEVLNVFHVGFTPRILPAFNAANSLMHQITTAWKIPNTKAWSEIITASETKFGLTLSFG